MRSKSRGLVLAGALALAACSSSASVANDITLPPGFRIETYVTGVPNARSMALGGQGTLFVGTMRAGKVYAVIGGPSGPRRVITVASGLNVPNGVAFHDGDLYVAENDRVLRYEDIESRLESPPEPAAIATLPGERHHGWRYIAFGPDDRLYVAIGAPCNVCDREGYATIIRMRPDGSGRETIARGVRNSVGFTWHPQTGELWFTDNGRDLLGDDVPSCELNRLETPGSHFGFPFCHAGEVVDPELGEPGACERYVPPVRKLGPHVAPLGVKFYTGELFPREYRGRVFIAEHGSWNRSERIGYRITTVGLDGSRAVSYEPFATGWLRPDGQVTGRPVDLLVLADGSLLVSDDHAGAIYRITYGSTQ